MLLTSLPSTFLFRHSLHLSMNTGGRDDFDWSRCCTGSNLGLDPSSFLLKLDADPSMRPSNSIPLFDALQEDTLVAWSYFILLDEIISYPIISYPYTITSCICAHCHFRLDLFVLRMDIARAHFVYNFLYHHEGIFASVLPFLSNNRIRKESRFTSLLCQLIILYYIVPFHLHVIFILFLV